MDLMSTAQLLGSFGEFFGAIAVVATLGYLAIQIRHNTRSAYVSRSNAAQEQLSRMHEQVMNNKELAELVARCRNSRLDELSPADDEQLERFANLYVNIYAGVHTSYQSGEFTQQAYENYGRDFRRTLATYPALAPRMRAIVEQFDEVTADIFQPLFH